MSPLRLLGKLFGHKTTSNAEEELFKADLKLKAGQQLREMLTDESGKHSQLIQFYREHGSYEGIETYASILNKQLAGLCEHSDATRKSQEGRIPEASNPRNTLPIEIQNWSMAAVAVKLSRGLDIGAAFQVGEPFVEMMMNRDYLLAIVKKNEGDDGFGVSVSLEEYVERTAPEITYMLMMQAQKDHFEADFWSLVSLEAGNAHALERTAKATETISRSSLEYWSKWRKL